MATDEHGWTRICPGDIQGPSRLGRRSFESRRERSVCIRGKPWPIQPSRPPHGAARARRCDIARMKTTRLYVVRHGATQLTAEDRFSGSVGVDLSDAGRRQAARLGDRLRDEGITACYSSPLSRTLETAQLVVGRRDLHIETRDALREISHGHWEGLTRREVEARHADEYAAW